MIWHQAVTQNVCIFFPFSFYFLQKIKIIGFGKKDGLLIITPVINMVNLVGFKMHEQWLCYQIYGVLFILEWVLYLLAVFGVRCLATVNIIQVQGALVFTEVQSAGSFRSGLTPIALQFRCLATVNIIQVQGALVFTEVQSADSFRSGLTPIALQFHPQKAMQDYRHRDYRQE
jgi:hypothetical protein